MRYQYSYEMTCRVHRHYLLNYSLVTMLQRLVGGDSHGILGNSCSSRGRECHTKCVWHLLFRDRSSSRGNLFIGNNYRGVTFNLYWVDLEYSLDGVNTSPSEPLSDQTPSIAGVMVGLHDWNIRTLGVTLNYQFIN
jgi:hypothetical protein